MSTGLRYSKGPYQARVDFANRVESPGPDETPDDRAGVHGLSIGASEPIGLVVGTNAFDVAQHPKGNAHLGEGSENRSQPLCEEQRPRGNLQVMGQFH